MSKTLREILRDPKKRIELENGICKLRGSKDTSVCVTIGKHIYKVSKIINGQNSEKEKNKPNS